jgi:hypothetical protein
MEAAKQPVDGGEALWHLQLQDRSAREKMRSRIADCALMARAASDLALAGPAAPRLPPPFPCVTSIHKPATAPSPPP